MSLAELKQNAVGFDFYQAVYALERQLNLEQKQWQGVGRDGFPGKEIVRFKSVQHLGFPGQPIVKVTPEASADNGAVAMHVSFMGLTGPTGVLPQHYTEMVLQRIKQRDTTMRDFFDLFNHRLVSLYYRSWEKYRFACQYEMAQQQPDSFTRVLANLSGAKHSLALYYAGFFSQQSRSAEQLICILRDLLGIDVKLDPLQGSWLKLAPQEQSELRKNVMTGTALSVLGQSAMLGSKVWDVSSAIELQMQVKPHGAAELMPGSAQQKQISALLAEFLPAQIKVRVKLQGRHVDFPSAQLNSATLSLGRSGSLAVRASHQHHMTQLSYQLVRS